MNEYDYIIIGAGASGLLLADAMLNDSFFDNKKILLLDKDAKNTNDRTWCFWEEGNGQFEAIIHKRWSSIHFQGEDVLKRTDINPYSYKMIRSIDFYKYYLGRIKESFSMLQRLHIWIFPFLKKEILVLCMYYLIQITPH